MSEALSSLVQAGAVIIVSFCFGAKVWVARVRKKEWPRGACFCDENLWNVTKGRDFWD